LRVVLDHCVDWRLGRALVGHEVRSAQEAGLHTLKNGEFLRAATSDFDVVVTTDTQLKFQQNLAQLPLAVIVLVSRSNRLGTLLPLVPKVLRKLDNIKPGEYGEIGPD
jgi:hypothetical protein